MIRVKYDAVMQQGFMEAMSRLAQSPIPTKKAYTLGKLAEALETTRKKIRAEYEEQVIKAFAKFENGKIVPGPRTPGHPPFVLLEGKTPEDYQAADEAFREQEANITRKHLTAEWLEETFPTISAADLTFFFPFIADQHNLEEDPTVGSPGLTGPRAVS